MKKNVRPKMSKGSGYRPVDRKKWDAWWDEYEVRKKEREVTSREKELQDKGLSVSQILSDEQVRDNLGLPTTPELCDINCDKNLGCNLPESRDGCKGCTIGRLIF